MMINEKLYRKVILCQCTVSQLYMKRDIIFITASEFHELEPFAITA